MSDILLIVFGIGAIALFSVLAACAEAKMWRRLSPHNGGRRALQRFITLGKSHLR